MKASTLLNILSHLPADAEIVLGEAESAIAAEFRKLVPGHIADKVLPLSEVPATSEKTTLRTDGPTLKEYLAAGYSADSYPPTGYAAREEKTE